MTLDFWPDSGHHLLQADSRGWLQHTLRLKAQNLLLNLPLADSV